MIDECEDGTRTRPRRIVSLAVVLVVGVQVLGIALGDASTPGLPGWLLALDILAGLVGCALMPALLRSPAVPAYVLAALSVVAPTTTAPAAVAVLYVARWRPLRQAAAVASVAVVAHLVRWVWWPVPGLAFGWWALLVLAVAIALLGWGTFGRARAELLQTYRERALRAEAEQARRVAEARTAERTRIAREMHDVLAHRLSLVATHAGALEFRPDAKPEQLSRAAGVVRAGLHQALDELRDLIAVVRDESPAETVDRPQPDVLDIARLVEESRAAGMTVTYDDGLAETPHGLGRTAYRVVQEALTNARKHAPDQPVSVGLSGRAGQELVVDVSNPTADGLNEASEGTASGVGLIGLAERVELAGGSLEHGRTGNGTFRLTARLPWPR